MVIDRLGLLYPKVTQIKNRIKFKGEGSYFRALLMTAFGIAFWAGIFFVFFRVLTYFKGIDVFGDFLAAKLLSMIFLTFFSILIFSNVIAAISAFFISEELQLIISTPFDYAELYFSKLAETILNSHPAIQRQGDRIIGTHPEDGRKLKTLLDRAIQDMLSEAFEPLATGLRSGNGRGPLPVLVTSVKPGNKLADPEAGRIRAAMYFSDPTHSHPILPGTLTETYGLTAAEAWVAISVANGLSLEDVAEQSGTSINTARSQLRSIFRKTDTSRQSELVKLLLTGPFGIAS